MAINTSILKSYAPQARRDFIVAVKMRAARFGIVEGGAAVIQEQGEVAIINGEAYPRAVARQCRDLESKIALRGFDAVMEEVAYTWFNRFAAIRYMELHGYLDHGFRVLSHPGGETSPEVVQHADRVVLPGLKADRIVDLKLDGRKDEELYRMLLVAQCNALHAAMPFLFERINDETELLLPDNLLHSDSVIREMVRRIPEADWQDIEIIGWLYQFYISEKKDQVIGKVVKSEDIPAATQLFTPNWIVKYMVQNSLGAKWLATYPDSPLKAKMEFYVEQSEQPEDVLRQIEDETPKSLDPETLTFLDPASGSGHILVEAYDLLKEIYLERGYRLRDIPRLILEKNLYGLDIDDRAAQLSGFALMMRARADDRRILSSDDPVLLNVLAIQDSGGLDMDGLAARLASKGKRFSIVPNSDLLPETLAQPPLAVDVGTTENGDLAKELVHLFANGKTLGSLISVPSSVSAGLSRLQEHLGKSAGGDLADRGDSGASTAFLALIKQASIMARQYDVVAANPPYMGAKGMNLAIKEFAQKKYPNSKSDLFAMFMERSLDYACPKGYVAMINMQSWMFLTAYEKLRTKLLAVSTIQSMLHLGARAFDTIGGEVVSTTTFVLRNSPEVSYVGTYLRLVDGASEQQKSASARLALRSPNVCNYSYRVSTSEFQSLPGKPIAYWGSKPVLASFKSGTPLSVYADLKHGMSTSDNNRFLRQWFEVSAANSNFEAVDAASAKASRMKWFPFCKGGGSRRWYGNADYVVNWYEDGKEIKNEAIRKYPYLNGNIGFVIGAEEFYFKTGVTWSSISSASASFRSLPSGFIICNKGQALYGKDNIDEGALLALLNSKVASEILNLLSPTIGFELGYVRNVPIPDNLVHAPEALGRLLEISKTDWDTFELSWDFLRSPVLDSEYQNATVGDAYERLRGRWRRATDETLRLEQLNNSSFVTLYGLEGVIDPSVPVEDVTLTGNPAYRYGGDKPQSDLEASLLADTMREFISYAVGCMLGRYSLDKPGLILANQRETLDEYLAKVPSPTFLPDADNIIPMLDDNWFEDDVGDRFLAFLKVTFGAANFNDNLAFIETAIGKDVRKFFKRDFFSDHLKRYKRRPIYWVFSSGKEKAFEAIVYMHRYNEGTLARMRMNYVVPLQSQMASRIERLAAEANGAALSSAERKRKDTQRAKLIKQSEELGRFEEELRHLADQRIQIDLDDGVKVNYAKFGNLLAETKAVVGKDDD